MNENLQSAVKEVEAYNRMGGINRAGVADIAQDHGVELAELLSALEWED